LIAITINYSCKRCCRWRHRQ